MLRGAVMYRVRLGVRRAPLPLLRVSVLRAPLSLLRVSAVLFLSTTSSTTSSLVQGKVSKQMTTSPQITRAPWKNKSAEPRVAPLSTDVVGLNAYLSFTVFEPSTLRAKDAADRQKRAFLYTNGDRAIDHDSGTTVYRNCVLCDRIRFDDAQWKDALGDGIFFHTRFRYGTSPRLCHVCEGRILARSTRDAITIFKHIEASTPPQPASEAAIQAVFRQIQALRSLPGFCLHSQKNDSDRIVQLHAKSITVGHLVVDNGKGEMVASFVGIPRVMDDENWIDVNTSKIIPTSDLQIALCDLAKKMAGPLSVSAYASIELTEASTHILSSQYPEGKLSQHVEAIARDITIFGYGFTVVDISSGDQTAVLSVKTQTSRSRPPAS